MEECPQSCGCEDAGEVLCWLEEPGCDLHSSDAYLLHRRGMKPLAEALLPDGVIVDNGALQRMPHQLIVTPQLNYQTTSATDFTSLEKQKDVTAMFMERCKLGVAAPQAEARLGSKNAARARLDIGEENKGERAAARGKREAPTSRLRHRETGETATVMSAVAAFGGTNKLKASKARLGIDEIPPQEEEQALADPQAPELPELELEPAGFSYAPASPPAYPVPLVVSPPEPSAATAAIIMLHGCSQSSSTYADWPVAMPFAGVKWIFPQASDIPVTMLNGAVNTAWYDMNSNAFELLADDRERIMQAVAYLTAIVDGVVAEGIPSERILVAGFSQGGAIALAAALRSQRRLAGVAALSTYLPMREDYPAALGPFAAELPILAMHGDVDQILSFQDFAVATYQKISSLVPGTNVRFEALPGLTHAVREDEIGVFRTFAAEKLGVALFVGGEGGAVQ